MATKVDSSVPDVSSLGINVDGDMALQVIEESCSSDEDEEEESGHETTITNLSHLPHDLVPSSSAKSYGTVQVTNSENVQLGNNTYFHGNVVIKQIIHTNKSGIINPAYVSTTEETQPTNNFPPKTKDLATAKIQIHTWHKIIFSTLCVIIVGVVCILIFLLRNQNSQEGSGISTSSSSDSGGDDNSSKCSVVEGAYYNSYQTVFITVIVLFITIIYTYMVLIRADCVGFGMASTAIVATLRTETQDPLKNKKKRADQLLIAPDHLRIVERQDWLAQPPTGVLDKLRLPAPWVIIAHTATENCFTQSKCVLRVRLIQSYHVDSREWFDIGYNFLVGGDGSAYVGRGWDYIGAHTKGYNRYSIAIAFIGTFTKEAPPIQQVEACKKLIKLGVEQGKIAKDYKLFAHRQLMSTESPGETVYEIMKEWPHFVTNLTDVSKLLPNY